MRFSSTWQHADLRFGTPQSNARRISKVLSSVQTMRFTDTGNRRSCSRGRGRRIVPSVPLNPMSKHFTLAVVLFLFWTVTAWAQFDFVQNEPDGSRYIGGPRLGKSQIQIYRAGIVIEPSASMTNVQITVPVPINWQEQRIISVNEEKMDAGLASQIEYQIINGGAQEMRLQLEAVQPTKPLEIVVAFEIQN